MLRAATVITRLGHQKPSYATAHSSDNEHKNSIMKPWRTTPVTDQTQRPAVDYSGVTQPVAFLHRRVSSEPVQLGEGESILRQ
jgi:hypothetical protein